MKHRTKRKENENLPFVQTQEVLQSIRELLIQGLSKTQCWERLEKQYPLTITDFDSLWQSSKNYFEKRVIDMVDLPDIMNNHIVEYEKIYQYFDSVGYLGGKRKAMLHKEKLLGFLKEENVLEFNQINNTVVETNSVYVMEKLSKEEQERLSNYLTKVEKNKNDRTLK